MASRCSTFRQRLRNGDILVGSFLKTPSSITAEMMALSDLDAVCIDAEHAPFGPLELDACVAALRAGDCPSIVRVADPGATAIRQALDSGATGILVPHVTSAKQAAAIARSAHFGDGGRGFAGSTRSAGYTTKSMQDHLADSAAQTTVIVQIEDLDALDNVADIASVDGVDAVFIGRIDLAVALGLAAMDQRVIDTVAKICSTARGVGTTVGMFTPAMDELPGWKDAGASLFLLSSDQSLLLAGANALSTAAD